MPNNTLESLFLRFREEGDPTALGQVFDRTAPGLVRLSQRLLGGDRSRAEDLVAETFLAALQKAGSWDSSRPVLPWLVGILGIELRRERRREGRSPDLGRLAEDLKERSVPRPEELSAEKETRSTIERAIAELPRVLRDVVSGKLLDQRESADLAAELGLSGGALRVRLHRGLLRLRQVLPAGIATVLGLLGLRTSRLSAMRAQLLTRAGGSTTSSGLTTGSALMTKQGYLLGSACALALLVTGYLIFDPNSQDPLEQVGAAPATQAQEAREDLLASLNPSNEVDPNRAAREVATTPLPAGPQAETAAELLKGGSLGGTVLGPDGEPVPFATIEGWNSNKINREPDITLRADNHGEFRVEELGPQFVLTARTDSLACAIGLHGDLEASVVAEGLTLTLSEPWTLRGRVQEPSGKVVAGAKVTIAEQRGSISDWQTTATEGVRKFSAGAGSTVTDEQGVFHFSGLAKESVSLGVSHSPYNAYHGNHRQTTEVIEIVLDRGLRLRGRVASSDGEPAVDAKVHFFPFFGNAQNVPYWSSTDRIGLFDLTGINRPREWGPEPTGIVIVHAGHAIEVIDPVSPSEGGGPLLSVQLQPESVIRGKVLDTSGDPVSSIRLRIEGDRLYTSGPSYGHPKTWEFVGDINETHSQEDGSFSFENLYAGEFSLRAFAAQSKVLSIETTVTTQVGQSVNEVVLVLDEEAMRKVVLQGMVADKRTGEAITQFGVYVGRGNEGRSQAFNNAEGQFEVIGLDPGDLTLTYDAPGYASQTLPAKFFEEGTHALSVRLAPSRSLSVRVLTPDGKPCSGARVSVQDAGGQQVMLRSSAQYASSSVQSQQDGMMELHGLPSSLLALDFSYHGVHEAIELDLTEPYGGVFEVVLGDVVAEPIGVGIVLFESDGTLDESKVEEEWRKSIQVEGRSDWFQQALKDGHLSSPTGTLTLTTRVPAQQIFSVASATWQGQDSYLIEQDTRHANKGSQSSHQNSIVFLGLLAAPGSLEVQLEASDYQDRVLSMEVPATASSGQAARVRVFLLQR